MERIKAALQDKFVELYSDLSFALPNQDCETLRRNFCAIAEIINQTPLHALPYKLFQLTFSPSPFTRLLASGALSIHYELDKKHPVHSLIQELFRAAHVFKGAPSLFDDYISKLVSESPDLHSLLHRLDAELDSLPEEVRFALTTVVVNCAA